MSMRRLICLSVFFFQAEDGIRDLTVTGVQTCALPIYRGRHRCGLASLLQQWPLALDRLRLVLAIRLFVGLGALPLWPVVSQPASRLEIGRASCRERV